MQIDSARIQHQIERELKIHTHTQTYYITRLVYD